MKHLPLLILLALLSVGCKQSPKDGGQPPVTTADTIGFHNGLWICGTQHPHDIPTTERTTRPPDPLDGVAAKTKLWPVGSTLRVGFLAGSQIERDSVKRAWTVITTYANLNVSYPDAGPYDIRVDFANAGAWSYIGTDAKYVTGGPTVNLAPWALNQRGAYVHEFQHAIGLLHEQQHPNGVCYDTLKTLAYYKAWQGWSDAQTYWNVLTKHNVNDVIMIAYAPRSNMHYPVPASITCNGVGIPGGNGLIGNDIDILKKLYPGRGTPPTDPPIEPPTGTSVTLTAAQAQALYAQTVAALTAANTGKQAAQINFGQAQNMVSAAQTNLTQSQISLNAAETTRVKAEAAVNAAKLALKIQ